MSKLFKNKAKLLYFAYGVLFFVVLLAALVFMTNYAHIHVYYTLDANKQVVITATSQKADTEATNRELFDWFAAQHNDVNMDTFKFIIYNFQADMSILNTMIVWLAVVGLVSFAALLICANHSRRIYYKSNLICGIVAPLITFIFTIVVMVKNFILMGTFNENAKLFNEVAVIQDPDNQAKIIANGAEDFIKNTQPCNNVTFILFTVLYAIVAIFSIAVIVYAVRRYLSNTEERNEIIRRAAENNGQ